MAECELTHVPRQKIDVALARQQHRAYEDVLRKCGAKVVSLSADDALADSCFVEDTLVVLDRVAIATRPGSKSRVREVEKVAHVAAQYRVVSRIDAPGTLDGGDVLRIGRTLYVGRAREHARTNDAGVTQLRTIAERYGYQVRVVAFEGCLHLKTCVTYVGSDVVLVSSANVSAAAFDGCRVIEVSLAEANGLLVGDRVVMPQSARGAADRLGALGFSVEMVDISEFEKAEAGVTCLSVLVEAAS
jgi:dimethylargininase